MIPYPSRKQKDFGDVDGDGKTEDLSADAARQKVVVWFLRTFAERWKQTPRRHLQLWGFYWMNEGIHPQDEAVVKAAAAEVHALGYKFHWIPWFNAPGVEKWRELGFDLVVMQPNYAFIRAGGLRIFDENRLTLAANQCRRLGMGIEMELNEALLGDPAYRINLQLYLDHGDESLDGYQAGAVRAYYQGYDTIARLCRSDQPILRQLYDDLYRFHKGVYQRRRPYQPLAPPVATNDPTGQAKGLVDGLWKTRPDVSPSALALIGPRASLAFDLKGIRLVSDVRVHFPPEADAPRAQACAGDAAPAAPQRISIALSSEQTGEAFEQVATIDDVVLLPEHGGGFAILNFAPRLAGRMRLDFDMKQGERIAIDEVLLMPAPHLLWGSPCEVSADATGPVSCLTDGIMGGPEMVQWPKGNGLVRVNLTEAWYAQSLLVHFRRLNGKPSAPKLTAEISAEGTPPERREAVCQFSDNTGLAILPVNRPVQRLVLTIADAPAIAVDEIILLPGENLARGCAYTLDPPFHAKYPDPAGRKLTDGQVTTRGFGDGKTVGWAGWAGTNTVTIVVDTGEIRPIDSVEVHVEGGEYGGVRFPERTAVSVSEDGRQWTKVSESQAPPRETTSVNLGGPVCLLGWLKLPTQGARGRHVKLRISTNAWLMVSEIRVLSKGQNVALGRPYSLAPPPTSDDKYADNTGKLTDGIYSKSGAGWSRCAGFDKADPTITVDLGSSRRLAAARVHLVGGGPGGVYFPKEVSVSTSDDGNTWTPVGATRDHPKERGDTGLTAFMGLTFEPRGARFVRFHLKRHGWAMPDEVEVIPALESKH
jgi:hypothetical protein